MAFELDSFSDAPSEKSVANVSTFSEDFSKRWEESVSVFKQETARIQSSVTLPDLELFFDPIDTKSNLKAPNDGPPADAGAKAAERIGITTVEAPSAQPSDGSNKPGERVGVTTVDRPGETDENGVRIGHTVIEEPSTTEDTGAVKSVNSADLKEKSEALFDKIDTDHDGFLSQTELSAAVQNDQFKGEDAQVVAALYDNRNKLQKLSNDEFGPENDGITKADLAEFDKLEAAAVSENSSAFNAKKWMDNGENFKKADSDGDGFLSEKELDAALATAGDSDKQALEYLKKNFDKVQSTSNDEFGFENDGITRKDITDNAKASRETDEAKLVREVNHDIESTAEGQHGTVVRDLYADKDNPINSINPEAIKQGQVGDCFFEASLASVAQKHPELIQKMIKDNGDGTYTVTFPGDPTHPVTVKAPTDAERGLYNGGSEHGSWASVLEKAYGQYLVEHQKVGVDGKPVQEAMDDGGRDKDVLKLLTGKEAKETDFGPKDEEKVKQEIMKAVREGKSICTAHTETNGDELLGSDENTPDGFSKSHSYTVVGFDPNGPDGGTVIIRNPHGGEGKEGTIAVPMKQYMKNFNQITVEG